MTTNKIVTDEMIIKFVEVSKEELITAVMFDDLRFTFDDAIKQKRFNKLLQSFEPSDKAKQALTKLGVS